MKVATFASVLSFVLISAVSQAQITIYQDPGNFTDDENVLFNDPSLQQQGTLVQGRTNRQNWIVDFRSDSELDATGGQAMITEIHGRKSSFNDLSVEMHDADKSFHTLIWNLNAEADGQVTFTINHSGGVYTQTFNLEANGENWFRMQADSGTMFNASFESTVGINDVKQVRLGAVPEPASLLGLGLGAVAFLRRRNKKTV
ncbi:MAG: PEP-CTERM sorting domain-containing protein [Fimbriimonas sp.]